MNAGKAKGVLCATVLTAILSVSLIPAHDKTNLKEMPHKVSSGETLWSIAKEYKPENISMGEYMDFVYGHNDGGIIYPGDIVIMGVFE